MVARFDMSALTEHEQSLFAPGAPFELADEDVLGSRMTVFKHRIPSLRTHIAAAEKHGDAIYAQFDDRSIRFDEIPSVVGSVAKAFAERYEVGPGDRVAILAANSLEWIVSWLAAVSLGAIGVGMNGWWVSDEIMYAIDLVEPKLVLADEKRLDRLPQRGRRLSAHVVDIEHGFSPIWNHDRSAPLSDAPIGEDDPAGILFTSGTTGRPKGVVSTHRNICGVLQCMLFSAARGAGMAPQDGVIVNRPKLFTTYPMFHVAGLYNTAVFALVSGTTTIWNVGRFDPERALRIVEREKVTSMSFVPTVAWRTVNSPDLDRYDLSSVVTAGGGSATVSPALRQRLAEVFPNAKQRIGIGYGMTESTAFGTTIGGPAVFEHADSVGRPAITQEIDIRDEHGVALPEGEVGEVYIRSPLVMLGYWRNPEATAAVIREDRWLRTGDIGWLEDDWLYLSSRRTDLIIRGGENISPVEIENLLESHPDVREVAVIGVTHEELGQEVKAVVVLREGALATADELGTFVGERLAYFKVPAHWELRTEPLPRNATGKVLKDLVASGAAASSRFVED